MAMNRDLRNAVVAIEENVRRIGSILVVRHNLLEGEKPIVSEHRWAFMKHHYDLYTLEKAVWDSFLKIKVDLPEDKTKALFDAFTSAAGLGVAVETGTLGITETKKRILAYKIALDILVSITGTPHQVGA